LPRLGELVSRPDRQTADRELLRRFSAEQDEAAFAEIVRRHGPMLLRVCQRILHNGHDAEDVAQAAFLLLAQKVASLSWHDSVAGWLFQTAYRLSLKARVAASRRAHHEAQAVLAQPPDPAAELTVREMQAVLDEELSRLPEKYRAPIVLCCLEGRSRDEAASCLGWSLAAVKDRLEQGRERLRARLARRGVLLGTALTSAWLLEGATCAGLSPHATALAAVQLATGQATLASLLPPRVAELVKGVTTTMLLSRVTIVAVTVIALALGGAAGVTRRSFDEAPPPPAQAQAKPAPAAPAAAPVQPEAVALTGHKGAINAVAFAPGGKTVATAGADGTVRVWDTGTGVQLHRLEQPGKAVGIAFSPDGKTLVASSVGQAGAVIGWGPDTGKQLWRNGDRQFGTSGAVTFSPDGKMVMAGCGGSIGAIQASSGKLLFLFRVQQGATTALACSPDGKLVAFGSGGTICMIDPATGRLLQIQRSKGTVTALAFLPGRTRIAVADGGKAVLTLDTTTGRKETAFEGTSVVRTLAVSADRKRVATVSADGTVLLWDASGKQERRFSARGMVDAVAFSHDGKRLATAGADGVIVWDLTRDEKPLPRDFKLTAKQMDALWADLASTDGGKVYAAARLLRGDPARAVPFLQERLKAKVPGPDQKKLKALIADLDSDEFKKREAAMKELEKLGATAETALRDALAAGPGLEVKVRLERLLKQLGSEGKVLTVEQQRDVRALRVLEQAGTPQAKKLLEVLSKESPGWWVTQEAKEALRRLAQRDSKP
jgi:RNA polymerase sigma factor (sigma-70 family)